MRKSIAVIFLFSAVCCFAGGKIHPSLESVAGNSVKVWVFFDDKPMDGKSLDEAARQSLSRRAFLRRQRDAIPLDIADVPVSERYIGQIESSGGKLLRESRWLNGASFIMPTTSIRHISALPFVREIRPVRSFRRPRFPEPRYRPRPRVEEPDSFYGAAYEQLKMIGATYLHDAGYAGQGVLVGMLDSGFRLTHNAFDSLDLIAKYDFLHNDSTVDYDSLAGDSDESGFTHGTQTLGCIAGYLPGVYIGAAYRASFALAKTEDVDSEFVTEEDNWVAGIEWLDSVGADIVSSSLGYGTFDEDTPYTFDDLDGNTAIVTIAADIAASRGICVVNSAGNYRNTYEWPHIIAPADGDSVFAIGAIDRKHVVAHFSSPGPTADGRIKPDCAAMGFGVALLDPSSSEDICLGAGTSFACPLVAGLCAAVKSADPDLSGYDLALAVRNSGDRRRAYDPSYSADSANNDYGWGIPQGPVAAGLYDGFYGRIIDAKSGNVIPNMTITLDYDSISRTVSSDTFGIFVDPLADIGDMLTLSVSEYVAQFGIQVDDHGHAIFLERLGDAAPLRLFPNPASDSLIAVVYNSDKARLSVFTADGAPVFDRTFVVGAVKRISWKLTNDNGQPIANGVYIVRLAAKDNTIVRKIAVVR